jgi:hypothetical protein
MYTIQDATSAPSDGATITVIIEDSRFSAVSISTIPLWHFELLLATALLPPSGTGTSSVGGTPTAPTAASQAGASVEASEISPQQQAQRARLGRWISRPIYMLVEGVCITDPGRDIRVYAGMLSTRGGEASVSSSQSTDRIVLQVEYLPSPFFPSVQTQSAILGQYLDAILPKSSTRKDLSLDITSLDWRHLLGVSSEEPQLPKWGKRNTAWCLVKMLKASGLSA